MAAYPFDIKFGRHFALGLLLLAGAAFPTNGSEARRVLIVHSFGMASPPFTTHSTAFEEELTQVMGERVDIGEVSLDTARFAIPDIEQAMVEYLRQRQSHWQPDLVVPIGSPAGVFVARYRNRLFPSDTPVLYTGMDQRRLPPGTLDKNAGFVGESFDFPGMVEDMLQIAPATTNIAVVIGASPVEKYWATAIQKEWASYTNRVGFTWLNDLSFDQVTARVAHLPPRSFVFLILLIRDASGVTHNADDALARLHKVANAPVNSIFLHQLGLGIVGGRLYQAEKEGIDAARIAARVLHGEPIASFPHEIVGPLSPRYDWRELRRWKINESRLPAGSVILFRQPTHWERYRGRILALVVVVLLEAILIGILVTNLRRRRRMERLLRESEVRFRTVLDSAPVLIWMSDTDKLAVFFNKPWLAFAGRTLEQELGTGWTGRVHPDDRPSWLQAYEASFRAREPFTREFRLLRHDGEYRWVSNHGVPRSDAAGRFAGYVGSCMDVTAARAADAEAHQLRQELAHISRVATIGELTASIAHELNQPLTAILSNAQAGLRFMDSGQADPAELRDILRDIVSDDQRAGQVIRHLRALLRKTGIERHPLPLNDLIADVLAVVRSDAVLRNVVLVTDLSADVPDVPGDRIQLQQVLLNLILNAFEAMADTPHRRRRLTLRTRLVAPDGAQLDVIDNGSGIAPDKLGSIFEPFFTTKTTGMGMGLAVCRTIVDAHKGRLWAENSPEGGAVFHLALPGLSEPGAP